MTPVAAQMWRVPEGSGDLAGLWAHEMCYLDRLRPTSEGPCVNLSSILRAV
jgi:hypothetical protein